jgi:hypothetical protein
MPGGARSDGSGSTAQGIRVSPGFRRRKADDGVDEIMNLLRTLGHEPSPKERETFDARQGEIVRSRYPDNRDIDRDFRRRDAGYTVSAPQTGLMATSTIGRPSGMGEQVTKGKVIATEVDLPDGEYDAVWGGYQMKVGDKTFKTITGVRSPGVKQRILVKDGEVCPVYPEVETGLPTGFSRSVEAEKTPAHGDGKYQLKAENSDALEALRRLNRKI